MSKQWPKNPDQSWQEWRDDLPWKTTDADTGWETWWNRQGQPFGSGTTSSKRKERRALAKGKGKGKGSEEVKQEVKEEVKEEGTNAPLQKGASQKGSSAAASGKGSSAAASGKGSSAAASGRGSKSQERTASGKGSAAASDKSRQSQPENPLQKGDSTGGTDDQPQPASPLQKGSSASSSSGGLFPEWPPLSKGQLQAPTPAVIFPFGMNAIWPSTGVEITKPKKQDTPSKPSVFGSAVLVPRKGTTFVPLSPTSESSEESERPKSKARPAASPLQKGVSSSSGAARSASVPQSHWFQEGYKRRVEEINAEKDRKFHERRASSAHQQSLAKGCPNDPDYEAFLKKGFERKTLDYWQERGPLNWSFPFPMGNQMFVGVDWHNTLQAWGNNQVPPYNLSALEKLLDKGFKVTILSFCFEKREAEVMENARALRCADRLEHIECCRGKVGPLGKTWLFLAWGITAVFDDNPQILQESLGKGLDVYPICTRHEHHTWFKGRPHQTFASAVEAFLAKQGLSGKD